MKKLSLLIASAMAVAPMTSASAAEFMFTFSPEQVFFGQPTSGFGTFTTSDTETTVRGRTALRITDVSGQITVGSRVSSISGLANGTFNYFLDGGGFLDGSGVRFFTEAGSDVRFFQQSSNGRYRVNVFGNPGGVSEFVTATATPVAAAVPEPTTWALMLLGFAAIGGAIRSQRKAKVTTKVAYA